MPSYTASLKLIQPATGEYSGTWGTQVNDSLTALVDKAVAGTTSITMTAANYTLTNANGVADEAKSMFLVLGGTPGASYQVIVPTASKLYFVTNSTGFAQTVKTSGGSGISVPNGASMTLRCDGTNVVVAENYFASLTLGAALPVASGGTGAATLAANNVLLGNGTSAVQVIAPGTTGNVLASNGTTWQSTDPNTLPSAFPPGTQMLFVQTTAPTGWTKVTTHDNKALRVVSGSVSSGGSVAFTTAFSSQTPSGTVGGTALTTAQLPSHSHSITDSGHSHGYFRQNQSQFLTRSSGSSPNIYYNYESSTTDSATTGITVNNTGSGDTHTHSFTGTAINLAVQYVDVIIATKN